MKKGKFQETTRETRCVVCGEVATRLNAEKQPVCRNHIDKIIDMYCPECGMKMSMREGKFGYFWGCNGFPTCDKTFSIRQGLNQIKE